MDENFYFHIRHLLANFLNLFQRQLAGENHAGQPHLLPEFYRRPVYGVSLYRQVNRHCREVLAYQHNQPWIGHDQRIRAHLDDGFQVTDKGFELGVMRGDVHHHVEFFSERVGFVDAKLQIFVIEFVIAHA
ncbi:Uncharacterised protein [Salmonella enterica subsp. enterica serovar Typhi]|nr:Uncharacterised protein [Salmonella enterica subsp. enterica serovar Typhi]CGW70774.1 Uncharacterised protein [Salmonella enterica subsp. enterica serovar Typhi]CHJ63700.1 Uncharacterised protein [Salmonella enterica subsp. enterica serovar Typhi]CQU47433.1 Uncharacterised protein [Salmonella enterica subsp. enterica serovar Typhi]CQW51717.1 Uncharacterised protein [Salmonella enterica subsp. enterica serovar Typhi]